MNRRSDQPRRRFGRLGGGSSRVVWAVMALALALTLVGWGASASAHRSASSVTPPIKQMKGKLGGAITVLANGDVDYLDPGQTYYAFGYEIAYATQRPLYSYKAESSKVIPDLASAAPIVSKDGLTVTVNIKHGIHFSPPVNREVTSKDIKYAMERGFSVNVPNSYASAYYGMIKGAPTTMPEKPGTISGIKTPSKYRIVFHLTRVDGAFASALVLPLTAPVPKKYAAPYDNGLKGKATYDQHVVATGPYMVKNDKSGNVIGVGWTPQVNITLVRNPKWNRATDYRPAYLKQITIKEGVNQSVGVAQILAEKKAGSADVTGDFAPLPADLAAILSNSKEKKQLYFTALSGTRDVALNSTKVPFNNLHVRRAVAYVLDRNAMRLQRGGAVVGDIGTHFISPGFTDAGFEAGGGYSFDPFPSPGHRGDVNKAKAEMKLAGYKTGMYKGPPIEMAAGSATMAKNTALVVIADLAKIGINVSPSFYPGNVMYNDHCNKRTAEPAICPNVGFLADFNDAETLLDVTFSGKHIPDINNSNWGQLNDPVINAAIAKAEKIQNPAKRGKAWGAIDKQVTLTAVEIPWIWENYATLFSRCVNPARQLWNQGGPDFSYMSVLPKPAACGS